MDFINFEGHTEIAGWRFGAIVVDVGERAIYQP